MLPTTLAYKYIAIAVTLAQINYYGARLHLPIEFPVNEQDITEQVLDQTDYKVFSVLIDAKGYSFCFQGGLRSVYKSDDQGRQSFGIPRAKEESALACMERASRMKYVISTNDLYHIATNWLVAMDIDVNELEKKHTPIVDPYPFYRSSRGWVLSPILSVCWHSPDDPESFRSDVTVEVSSVTGELLKLTQGRFQYSKKHLPLIHDLDKLAAISDAEFLKYSPLDKSNLVARFSDVNPTGVIRASSSESNAVPPTTPDHNATAK